MARKHGIDRGILEHPKGSGKSWVRIYVNGREKRYRADNKTQAKALYGRLKADIREGRYFPEKYDQPKEITLRVWVNRFLEASQAKGKQNQIRYGRWWVKLLGKKILHEITGDEVSRIQAKDLKKGKRDPQTVNRYLAFLKHVLNLAMKDGLIDRNPVCSVKFSPEPKGKLRFLSDGEITRLKEIMAPEDWPIVAFALETGLRQSEQFKARWEWIDLERGIFTIPHDKAGRTRHVPLTEGAKSILRAFPSWMISTYVFPSPRFPGQPMEGRAWVKKFYMPALERAKIEGANWHTLRHTFASRLAMSGVDIRAICELMGHTNLSTTMRYMHLSPDHLLDAVNRASLGNLAVSGVGTVTRTVTYEKETIVSSQKIIT